MTGNCFRFNRWCTMILIRTRKIARKRNYKPIALRENPQCNFSDIHANICQDEELNIPEDLLIEVLSRLPLKNRARLRCVSKQWERLISNHVALANAPKLLFSKGGPYYYFVTIDNETNEESICLPIEKHFLQKQNVKVWSSCHGLILIQMDNDLYLWNPLTSFFRKVLTIGGFVEIPNYLVDLCFCSINDEYKVVLVGNRSHYRPGSRRLYVATCGEKKWKKIKNVKLEYLVYQGPFFKGHRHWINDNYKDSTQGVISFDPSTNKLIEIATPQPEEGVKMCYFSLGVLDECLSMTRTTVLRNDMCNTDLLLMKEYGNGNSWEVMFVVSDDFTNTFFRTKSGELLAGTIKSCCCCYCINTCDDRGNFLEDIFFEGDLDLCYYKAICYEESLSSPTHIKSYD